MDRRRRAALLARVRVLNGDAIGTIFPCPDLTRREQQSEVGRAFTRICGHLGEALKIAEEALGADNGKA